MELLYQQWKKRMAVVVGVVMVGPLAMMCIANLAGVNTDMAVALVVDVGHCNYSRCRDMDQEVAVVVVVVVIVHKNILRLPLAVVVVVDIDRLDIGCRSHSCCMGPHLLHSYCHCSW